MKKSRRLGGGLTATKSRVKKSVSNIDTYIRARAGGGGDGFDLPEKKRWVAG